MYCVYAHINKVNRKVYIGITSNPERRWQHSGKQYFACTAFYNAIQKYGWNGFMHVVLVDGLTKEVAFEVEKQLIKENKHRAYNISDGGNTGPALFGERNPNYHKIRNKEHCERLSQSLKGHYVSEETKQKIKDNNAMIRPLMCVETQEVFNSITQAAERYDTFIQNIWRAVSGKRKSWHGLHFVYVDVS